MNDWRPIPLQECGDWYSGGTPARSNPDYWNGRIPWISAKSLHNYYIDDAAEYVTEEGAQNGTRLVPPGTILLLVRGMMLHKRLPLGLTLREATFNQDVKAIVPYENVSPDFLLYWFIANESKILNFVEESSHGTGRLPTELLYETTVDLPPLAEQKKIAAILSTWDEAIALTGALIEALQRRKTALMQRLLTGEVRFPGFVEEDGYQEAKYVELPIDWEYVPIGDIAESVSIKNDTGDDLPVLSCTKHEGLVDSLEYFDRQVFSNDTSSYKVVQRGQFAYATNHIEEGSIGYQDLYEEAIISPMYTVFETNDRVDDSFLYKVLKTELYRHTFEVNTSGTVNRRGSLRWNAFKTIKIPLPTLEEQAQIADVFDVVEEEIVAAQELKTQFERQKKGLMQQLLTGRIRVAVE